MAVHRTPPKCFKCGQDYLGIYQDQSDVSPMFVGDTFIRWDIEGHICTGMTPKEEVEYVRANHAKTTAQAETIVAQSEKFKSMFVDWELAKRLKNVGFDEPCFAYYWLIKPTFHYTVRYANHNEMVSKVSAPLWQQVVTWLDFNRVYIDVDHEFGEDWEYRIAPDNWKSYVDNGGNGHFGDEKIYTSRFEATKAAIDKALKIIENNNHKL